MRLFIAEKPSVAKAIAGELGATGKGDGFIECGTDKVTWCFGHMLEQADRNALGGVHAGTGGIAAGGQQQGGHARDDDACRDAFQDAAHIVMPSPSVSACATARRRSLTLGAGIAARAENTGSLKYRGCLP